MNHKPARQKFTVLQQVCKLIPSFFVSTLAREHGVDKKARTFSPWSHVVSLIYAQLAHAVSLHDVCDALRCHAAKLQTIREATPAAKNTLSHANRTRDPRMAEALFWQTLEHLGRLCPTFRIKVVSKAATSARRFKRRIVIVDSTVIELVSNCMDWASHRRRKAAAKANLSLHLQSLLPNFVVIGSGRENDRVHARELCANLQAGEICVFDRGYLDFLHFNDLHNRGVFWVTRAIKKMACRTVRHLIKKPQGKILSDRIVVLTGPVSKKKFPHQLRLVRALVEVDGVEREMTFMTNNLEWSASSIADLYKSRWAIEVFFKELKQTLQLSDFLGHNQNAITWQIWTALLTYVLLRFLAHVHSWKKGFKRLFCHVRSCLWDTYDISSLLAFRGTAPDSVPIRSSPGQPSFPGFPA
jgi:hypothetical protein